MAETKRRRRPAVSCTLCRRRKIRCNRELPCSNCKRSHNAACVFENEPVALNMQRGSNGERSAPFTVSPASTAPVSETESLKDRIGQLEQQLRRATSQSGTHSSAPSSVPNVEVSASHLGGTSFCIYRGDPQLGQHPQINRSVTHKGRMYGQTHWMNSASALLREIGERIEEHARGGSSENGEMPSEAMKLFEDMARCKQLGRAIKARRVPPWPCTYSTDLPDKRIADDLVECYLRTSERIYRVLHVPSFRRDYEALWNGGRDLDQAFVIVVKLVLTIGAVTYSEYFDLRNTAVRWVYEAESWLANPTLKHRLGIQYIQIHILLLIARDMVAVGEDMVWISAGSLFRSAIYMGLHRDPGGQAQRTTFLNEMHRRLWNTILELSLNASLTYGGPPLFGLDDFDTLPPSNMDDEQLTASDAVPKAEDEFSDVSIAVSLRSMLPARLAVCKFLNDFSSRGAYEETLMLDAAFKESLKRMRSRFPPFDTRRRSPSDFDIRIVDMVIHRYLAALHLPFFGSGLRDATHAYSRKVAVDSSLKTWYAANISPGASSATASNGSALWRRSDIARLTGCGSGFFRIVVVSALLVIGAEIREQLQEDDGFGPKIVRRDLAAVVEDAKAWLLWCIEAGETNIKSYMFVCLLLAFIDGLRTGLPNAQIPVLLIQAAQTAKDDAWRILEKMVEPESSSSTVEGSAQMPLAGAANAFEGWDFLDSPFNADSIDLISWTFGPALQSTSLW